MKKENIIKFKAHWDLLRAFAVAPMLVSLLIGFMYANPDSASIPPFLFAIAISVLILFAVHYHNTVADFTRGIDKLESGSKCKQYTASANAVLPRGLLPVNEVKVVTILFYLFGLLLAIIFALKFSPWILFPTLLGMGCGILYNEWGKYAGYGEPMVALAFGVAATSGGYLSVTGQVGMDVLMVSVVPGALLTLFYTINQYEDREADAMWGLRNIAIRLMEYPFPVSRYLEFGYSFVIYYHLFLIVSDLLPLESFVAILSTPLMFLSLANADTDERKTALYTLFSCIVYGSLLCVSLLFVNVF